MSPALAAKKIALFLPSFRGGGAERAMVLFAEELLHLGYAVDFLVAQDEGPLKKSLPTEARIVDFNRKSVSRTIPALAAYLRRERPAALYSTIVNVNIAAVCGRLLSGVRCPVIIRESNVVNPKGKTTLPRRIAGVIAPMFYRMADSIISVSTDVSEELSSASPALRSRISVLPNPVVSQKILGLGHSEIDHPWFRAGAEAVPVILGTGRLHPQKDFTTLISAFNELRKLRPARLMILGEGPERAMLEQQIASLGIQDLVSLPGFVDNPFPYMRSASVFVLSSRYEGMPNVLLQAMAFGTPVVATEGRSGAGEVIQSEDFGLLVPVGDFAAMARAIDVLVDRPRNSIAANFVAEQFSVERATREYLKVAGL